MIEIKYPFRWNKTASRTIRQQKIYCRLRGSCTQSFFPGAKGAGTRFSTNIYCVRFQSQVSRFTAEAQWVMTDMRHLLFSVAPLPKTLFNN